jgi:ParB-like chromosome segregation protein Spo0J
MELKIEYVDIGTLQTYANNAKIHTAEQIEQIKKSIEEFGMNDPIAVWKNNEIIEGHGRLIACTELGIEKVPVIRLDELSDEQRKAYMLVHNKLTMNTGFDFDLLEEELESLANIDMSAYGFEELEQELEEQDGAVSTESSYSYHEQYGVIVMCQDEAEQEEVYNRLTEEGFTCKVVAV